MKKLRTKYLQLVFFGLLAIAVLLLIPEWIPSWSIPVTAALVLMLCAMAFLLVILLVRLDLTLKQKKAPLALRIITIVLCSGCSLMILLALLAVRLFTMDDGLMFPQTLASQHDYPDKQVTIYVYETGWLDPQTTVKTRNGIWPVMTTVTTSYWPARDFHVQRKGDELLMSGYDTLHYDLNTKRLITGR